MIRNCTPTSLFTFKEREKDIKITYLLFFVLVQVETRAAFLLSMEVARLLGKQDCNEASDVETQLLRLLTPITKLYTAKQVRPLLQTKNCLQDQI